MKLNTFLNYGGNCAQAFRFYEENLGAKIVMMMTRGQLPDPSNITPETKDLVVHARLEIGGTVLQASDVPPERFEPMRSVYLSLMVDTIEDAERVYTLLSEGGQVFMPMEETFYAYRFAMLRDRFGTSWTLLNERPQV